MSRIFILSPARTSGKRASILMNVRTEFDLANRLRGSDGAPLGEVFSFLSGLYFRGKFAYSKRFASPPKEHCPHYVITSDAGLMDPAKFVSLARLKAFGKTPIDPIEPRYTRPLQTSVTALERSLPPECQVILLGSI